MFVAPKTRTPNPCPEDGAARRRGSPKTGSPKTGQPEDGGGDSERIRTENRSSEPDARSVRVAYANRREANSDEAEALIQSCG